MNNNKISTALAIMTAILAMALSLGGPPNLPRPQTLTVEPYSRLRSPVVKPERAAPVYHDGKLYVISSRKKLVSLSPDGVGRTEIKLDFAATSTPAIEGTRIYVGGSDGKLHCLNLADGVEIWNYDLQAIDISTPAVTENLVLFQTGKDLVLAVDKETGKWVWEYQHLRVEDLAVRGLCPPKVENGVVYVGLAGGALAAMNVDTGRLIWKSRTFTGEQFRDIDAPLEVDESSVYAMSVSGRVAAVSQKTGKTYWTYGAGGMSGLALAETELFIASDDGQINALDKVTGRLLWSTEVSDRKIKRFNDLPTRPVLFQGQVVTVTHNGKVLVLNPETGAIEREYAYYTYTMGPADLAPEFGLYVLDNQGVIRWWSNLD